MKKRLAISYIRFSTPEQSKGDSTRRQTEATEAYCKTNGLILTNQYRLTDAGKSAFKGKHRSDTAALGNLEKQVEAGQIPKGTVLIIESLDRLSRQEITTALTLFLNLINAGLEIVTLMDSERRYSKASINANPYEIMASISVMIRANEESATKARRATAVWQSKHKAASEGKHISTKLPAWLESKDGKYVVIPEKVKTIKRIFELYLSGLGSMSVAAQMVKEQYPNVSKQRKGRYERWHYVGIQRILKHKELTGYYCKVTPHVANFFPVVIPEKDFYAAQALLKQRNSYKGQRNYNPAPFSNLVRCSCCGEHIVKGHTNGYRYFQCQGSRLKLCNNATLPYDETERALLHVISNTDKTLYQISDTMAIEAQRTIDAVQGQLDELTNKITETSRQYKSKPSELLATILQELEQEQRTLTNNLEDAKANRFIQRGNWDDLHKYIRKELAQHKKAKITINPEGDVEFTMNTNREGTTKIDLQGKDVAVIIALRESLRSQIEVVNMDIQKKTAVIVCKSGSKINVEFRKSEHYPRTISYRVDKQGEWIKAQ